MLGSPATSKTLFLKSIKQKYGTQSLYYDFSNSMGRGFIKHLIKRYHEMNPLNRKKTVYLLLDEVEKIKPVSDLDMLLNLLEQNEIHYTKSAINEHIKLNVKVFATANRSMT